MTLVTSTRIRNFRFLTLRCGFLRVEYQSDSTDEKTVENIENKLDRIEKSNKIDIKKTDREIIRKNRKYEIGKNVKIEKNYERKIVENRIDRKNMKIDSREIDRNCKCNKNKIKIDRIKIGLKIVEKIVRIGSALSGLLPSLRHSLIKLTVA